jgi:hypothetical protein
VVFFMVFLSVNVLRHPLYKLRRGDMFATTLFACFSGTMLLSDSRETF